MLKYFEFWTRVIAGLISFAIIAFILIALGFMVVNFTGCSAEELNYSQKEKAALDAIGFRVIKTVPDNIEIPTNRIQFIEIKQHEYILYQYCPGMSGGFAGMVHNPDCRYCKTK